MSAAESFPRPCFVEGSPPAGERHAFPRAPWRSVQTKERLDAPTTPRAGNRGAGARPAKIPRAAAALTADRLSAAELACLPVRPGCLASLGIRELGVDPAAIAESTDWLARARALQWAGGLRLDCRTCKGTGQHDDGEDLVTCPSCDGTGDGRDRGRAIAACGRPALAMTAGGLVGLVGLRCRDRACPRCQRLRAIERAAELREAMSSCPSCGGTGQARPHEQNSEHEEHSDGVEHATLIQQHSCSHNNLEVKRTYVRTEDLDEAPAPCRDCGSRGSVPWRWQFATLTVPKVHATRRSCRATLDLVLDAWRALTRKSHARGREFADRFAGGVRSIEVVYRERGEVIRYPGGRTHTVDMTGWHVHVHALLDVAADVDVGEARGWLVGQWLDLTGGSARGQLVRDVERGDTGCAVELCKYVAKPLSQAMSPAVGRELFRALHSRRLLEGFGRWRSWRSLSTRETPSLLVGPSVGGLLARMHGEGPNPVRNFVGTVEGRRILADERRARPNALFEGHIDGERFAVDLPAAKAWALVKTGNAYGELAEQVRARGLSPPAWERDPFMWSQCRIGTP